MSLFHGLRQSLRAVLRNPGFAVATVIVLTLAIAVNTSVFTLVDELLLNPFPYREPNRLVMVWESNPSFGEVASSRVQVAWTNFLAWRAQSHSFEVMEAFQIGLGYNLTGVTTPERLTAALATPGFFQMLGVNAFLGRTFLPGDDMPGANRTVILTYAFATKHFGESSPVGKALLLDDVPYTVIGVLPKEFHLPALSEGISEYKPDVWAPLTTVSVKDEPQMAKFRRLQVCARLKPGVSLFQARTEMAAINERLAKENPELDRGYGINVFPLDVENTYPDFRNDLRMFWVGALLMLLLACTNLAGLMLIRTTDRRRDFGVMAALGADRWGLLSPVLSESFFLALIGGILGFLASYAGIQLIVALRPSDIHAPERLAVNLHSFIFNMSISLVTVLVFGLIPAWITTRSDLGEVIKSGRTGRAGRSNLRTVFVVVQVALALALAIAAALVVRSFQKVLEVDLGYRVQKLLTGHLALSPQRYATEQGVTQFCRKLREKLQLLPGVESVALVDNMPLYSIRYTSFEIEGRPIPERNAGPSADFANVTPNFFHTMNVALRQGRIFTDQDAESDPVRVVIINEALARQFWPNQSPVGVHIRPIPLGRSPGPWLTVIGVVGDFHQFNTETAARPEMFWPAKSFPNMTIVLRSSGDPSSLSASLQQAVWSLDPSEPLSDVQTFNQRVDNFNSQRRFNVLALGSFAAISIILMVVGIFGLVSSLISSHSRDIGIRLALGAQRTRVCLSLLRPILLPVMWGIVLGLILAYVAKGLIGSVLFGISPLDPGTYIVATIALIAVLLLTGLYATLRAARVDPAIVLREE